MQIKRFLLILGLVPTVLSSCNDENKTLLIANPNFLFNEKIEENEIFVEGNLKNFDDIINTDLNFIVFFSNKDCAPCERFLPIIKEYAINSHALVINVDIRENYDVIEAYGEMFYEPNAKGKILPDAPRLMVAKGNGSVYKVNNGSYMQTYKAFSNHMNSKFKPSNISYFTEEITGKSWINKEFTYLKYINNDAYTNKVKPMLKNVKKETIISKSNGTMNVSIIGRNENGELYTKKASEITSETPQSILDEFF